MALILTRKNEEQKVHPLFEGYANLLLATHMWKSDCLIVAQKITFAVFAIYLLDKRQQRRRKQREHNLNIYQEAYTMAAALPLTVC